MFGSCIVYKRALGIFTFQVLSVSPDSNSAIDFFSLALKRLARTHPADPAPRIIQECLYYKKNVVYEYTNKGAEVYKNRKIQKPDVEVILNEL